MFLPRLCALLLLAASCGTYAAADATLAALDLADSTDFTPREERNLHLLAEAAASVAEQAGSEQRASLDMRWDASFADDWRAGFSDRLDSYFYHTLRQRHGVNSLREAWLSYQLRPETLIDVGRINTRYGVALGYNPTDFLGRGTVRSAISADPETLRNDRLGNAMVRLQQFWDRAALTAIFSPKIASTPNDSGTSLDWGASNPRNRLLLSGSYRFAENLNPQLLLLQEEHRSPQFGANLSRVLSRSTLAYLEWAGGRQALAWQEALPESQWQERWRNRLAAGFTWTGENRLTLRLEGYYNGLADNKRAQAWLAALPPGASGQFTGPQQASEWMAARRAALVQGYWKDIVDRYDLNVIWQRDLQQSKNMGFAELRHHLGSVDLALQWQKVYRQDPRSLALAQADQRWQVSVGYYF